MAKLKVIYKNTSELIPYAMNARVHSQHQVELIAKSIEEFGFVNPVLVDGGNTIIAGHGRLMAAHAIGMKQVPVIMLDYLSDRQRRALVLADNEIASKASWDMEKLSAELSALADDEYDLSVIGFDEQELDALLKDDLGILPDGFGQPSTVTVAEHERKTESVHSGLTDDDQVPDVIESPTSQKGDVWILGNHRVMCGDSTLADDVSVLMQGDSADMIFTYPPWNVNYGAVKSNNPMGYKQRTILNDYMKDDAWAEFVLGFCNQLKSFSKAGAPIYLVMSAQEWPSIHKGLSTVGFHWSSTIIWAKDRMVLSRKDYHTQYEPIWYGWNEDGPRLAPLEDRTQTDVWNFARPSVSELHPTTKPVELIVRAITNSSKFNNIILDLFGGSGSTMIASEKTERRARLMELDPKYVDVEIKRWEEFTGQKAVHEATGKTFEELRNERVDID